MTANSFTITQLQIDDSFTGMKTRNRERTGTFNISQVNGQS